MNSRKYLKNTLVFVAVIALLVSFSSLSQASSLRTSLATQGESPHIQSVEHQYEALSPGNDFGINEKTLRLAVCSDPEDIIPHALQHVNSMKETLIHTPEIFGFTAQELSDMLVGNPFSILVYDDGVGFTSTNSFVFPLLFQGRIIGVLEVSFDVSSDHYCFSFGKAFGNELNELINLSTYDNSNGLYIIRIDEWLLATDGEKSTILLDNGYFVYERMRENKINSLISNFVSKENLNFVEVTTAIGGITYDSGALESEYYDTPTTRAYPNPLPVPHVAQTGVCGVAAWAAVLNCRFNKSYSNGSLAAALKNGGYINLPTDTPSMEAYRNYANDKYSAGCSITNGVLNVNTLKNYITTGKPIMGNWQTSRNGTKVNHAIIITGYMQNTSMLIYYLKNPWYTYSQSISVPNTNSVVYVNAGETWTLKQSVQ